MMPGDNITPALRTPVMQSHEPESQYPGQEVFRQAIAA